MKFQKIIVNNRNKTTIINQLSSLKSAYYIGKLNTMTKEWEQDWHNNKITVDNLENGTIVKSINKELIIIQKDNRQIMLIIAPGAIIDSVASIYKQSILIDKNGYNFSLNDILDNIRLL